jgi:hypothetical protein
VLGRYRRDDIREDVRPAAQAKKDVNYEHELQPWFKAVPREMFEAAGATARLAHADRRSPDLAVRSKCSHGWDPLQRSSGNLGRRYG